ncbi:MAG: multidrug effflux MFS transporter [Rhodospirillales bacterium]|jgi:DHA1 family bicyclomycin/chloramphenicol resistance-like MFS transporter|nr:multidrug effflux MFS transporter [Rhodospirillales bacterium]
MAWPRSKPDPASIAVGGLLTAMIALGQISTAIYSPSMPSLVANLETTVELVSLTLTVFLAGFAVSQLVFGPLSDRFGRRHVLVAGLVIFVAASIVCALAPTIGVLLVGRFFQSMGACAGAVVGRAVVRDVYGRERAARALAFIGVAFSVSPAVSPIIGGYLQVWFGWRSSFSFLALVGLAIGAATWTMLSETNRHPDPHALNPLAMARNFVVLMKTPAYVGYMLALSLVFAGLMAFVTASPFLLIDGLHLSPAHFGLLVALPTVGTLAGNLSAGVLTLRLGVDRMVLIGTILALAGGIGMAASGALGYFAVAPILASIAVFLFGMGIVMPNAMAGAMGPFPRMAGAASALLGFAQMGVGALASLAAGHLPHTVSQLPLGLVMTVLGGGGLMAFLALTWPHRHAAAPPAAAPPTAGG